MRPPPSGGPAMGTMRSAPTSGSPWSRPAARRRPRVNGGVLMATVLRCVLDLSPHPHPVATSAHFLRVPQLAPAHVEVTWLKAGKTAATARASLVQDGKSALELTVTTGTVPDAGASASASADAEVSAGVSAGASADAGASACASADAEISAGASADADASGRGASLTWTGAPPVLPPIEECVDLGPWPGAVGPDGTTGYAGQVEMRLDPATTGWRHGKPAGIPEMRGYFRLREHRDPDAYLLALAVDGMPPVVF